MLWSSELTDSENKYGKLIFQPMLKAVIIYVNEIQLGTKLLFHAYVSTGNMQIQRLTMWYSCWNPGLQLFFKVNVVSERDKYSVGMTQGII